VLLLKNLKNPKGFLGHRTPQKVFYGSEKVIEYPIFLDENSDEQLPDFYDEDDYEGENIAS